MKIDLVSYMGEIFKSLHNMMQGNLLIFTIGDVLRQFSMFITFPYFSLYVQSLGGSTIDIGIVNSFRPLTAFFLYPIAGYLSVRYSRIKIIAVIGYISSLIWSFFIFASDWRWLAFGSFLQGIMFFYFPAANSLMAESLPSGKQGLGYSLWMAIPLTAGIFSPLLGGYLITLFGVRSAMKFLFALTLIVSAFIATMNFKFLKEAPKKFQKETNESILGILVDSYRDLFSILRWLPKKLKVFGVMLVLGFLFNNMVLSYWVIYAIQEIGITEIQWGLVLFVSSIVNVVLLIPAGVVVDRYGERIVLTIALLIGAISTILFPFSRGFLDLVALFLIVNIANSFLMSGAPSFMTLTVPREQRGRVMSALGQGMLFINTLGGGGGGQLAVFSIIIIHTSCGFFLVLA
jgi:MFS family permease